MAQRYKSEVARARMAEGCCPECGETPVEHLTSNAFWLPRNCDLTVAGVDDRIATYQADLT